MMMMRHRRPPSNAGCTLLVLALLGVPTLACRSAGGVAGDRLLSPDAGAPRHLAPHGRHDPNEFAALERRLQAYRAERMRVAQVEAEQAPGRRCEEMYALMQSICEVQVKLCRIADAHKLAPSYQTLCEEARTECRDAQDSCETCVQQDN